MELQRSALYARGWAPASVGLLLSLLGGMVVGRDGVLFAGIGFLLGAGGLLGIVIGGVAIGVQLARD